MFSVIILWDSYFTCPPLYLTWVIEIHCKPCLFSLDFHPRLLEKDAPIKGDCGRFKRTENLKGKIVIFLGVGCSHRWVSRSLLSQYLPVWNEHEYQHLLMKTCYSLIIDKSCCFKPRFKVTCWDVAENERLLFHMCACLSSCCDCSSDSQQARWHGFGYAEFPCSMIPYKLSRSPKVKLVTSTGSCLKPGLSCFNSRPCVCVCVWSCVTTRVALGAPHPHLPPSPFASAGLTGCLHVVPTLSWYFCYFVIQPDG